MHFFYRILALFLFQSPMGDSENECLGLKSCTPLGCFLVGIADLIGFAGMLLLIAVPIELVHQALVQKFSWTLCWFLLIPIAFAHIGRTIFRISWWLATKKQFHYDYETRTAKWMEGDHEEVFPKT